MDADRGKAEFKIRGAASQQAASLPSGDTGNQSSQLRQKLPKQQLLAKGYGPNFYKGK